MTITQPMPAPRTLAEYEAAKPHMIDTGSEEDRYGNSR